MEKTLSSQASDWREGRRLRAFELTERGWKQTEIADDALGVTEGAVSQWMKRRAKEEEGVEGLRHTPPPGAPPRLSEEERAKLPANCWPREQHQRMVFEERCGHM